MGLVSRIQLEGKPDAGKRMGTVEHTMHAGKKAVGECTPGVGSRPRRMDWEESRNGRETGQLQKALNLKPVVGSLHFFGTHLASSSSPG